MLFPEVPVAMLQSSLKSGLSCMVADLLDALDAYTREHSFGVALLGERLARKMELPEEERSRIFWAGLVHDVGKIFVPREILCKPAGLTPEEFQTVQSHTSLGYQLLKEREELSSLAHLALHHHERWDGRGYPGKLQGEEIPLGARILGVADSWDAMTSSRPYRKALPQKRAMRELRRGEGMQFDPQVVEAFWELS